MEIKLSELMNAMEFTDADIQYFYDPETGETHQLIESMQMLDGENYDEEAAERLEENDWISLPDHYEIDEYSIMEEFIRALPENQMSDDLYHAIQGKGAFRRFRNLVHDYEEEERWEKYHLASLEQIGRNWAEKNGVKVTEDQESVLKYLHMQEKPEIRKILIVIDMQNDFIDGSLGTREAQAIVPAVIEKIRAYPKENVYATRDTHSENYLETQEGKYLPVKHCIKKTHGWKLQKDIAPLIEQNHIFNKPSFGSVDLAMAMQKAAGKQKIEIELVGLCTDICVVSNALLLKAFMPEVKISVDARCCAGVTPAKHEAALETMHSCQIQVEE